MTETTTAEAQFTGDQIADFDTLDEIEVVPTEEFLAEPVAIDPEDDEDEDDDDEDEDDDDTETEDESAE